MNIARQFRPAARRGAAEMLHILCTTAAAAGLLFGATPNAAAHGVIGKRFFPATIATDDPFVADELSLPTISTQRKSGDAPDDPYQRETEFSTEFTKRITPDFGLGFELGGKYVKPDGMAGGAGLNNLAISAKYQLFKNEAHEAILSLGLDTDIGGSGSDPGEADRYYTFTPGLFFGKGFGDLPDGMAMLKPLAVTGSLGIAVPTSARDRSVAVDPDTGDSTVSFNQHPDKLVTGFAIEYSIPYLQSFVRDVGLRAPFNRMTPLVEFSFETPLNRGGGTTTGTVNPGVVWSGETFQLGIEGIVPINSDSGHGLGVVAQVHFFLDDIFPKSIGKPLFGN